MEQEETDKRGTRRARITVVTASRPIVMARRWLERVLTSRGRSVAFVGVTAFCLAVIQTVARSWPPAPQIHDEFSYLLGADTFARGRLTNPPHPLWEHVETFHVLQRPSYASKYPPAQSAALALGQVLTGEPITGVWLTFGLMGAALTWMLLGWFSPRWSAWGALFTTLVLLGAHAERASWARSYWGGVVAVIGGAFVLGGIRRATTQLSPSAGWLTGLGLGILANSRPFEGMLAALPSGVLLAGWVARSRGGTLRERLKRVVLPISAVLALCAAFMGYYNWRVTGSATSLPYMEHQEAYGTTPVFIWQARRNPVYRNDEMRKFYASQQNPPTPNSLRQIARLTWNKMKGAAEFFVPSFAIPLLIVAATLRREAWFTIAVATVALPLAGSFATSWAQPHYYAPMVGALGIVFTGSARHLAALRVGQRRVGRLVVWGTLCIAALSAANEALRSYKDRQSQSLRWARQRLQIANRLQATGGKHLVFVRYGTRHSHLWEWVNNSADIDGSQVVWARALGPESDVRARAYFSDRTVWRLFVERDSGPYELQPLQPGELP